MTDRRIAAPTFGAAHITTHILAPISHPQCRSHHNPHRLPHHRPTDPFFRTIAVSPPVPTRPHLRPHHHLHHSPYQYLQFYLHQCPPHRPIIAHQSSPSLPAYHPIVAPAAPSTGTPTITSAPAPSTFDTHLCRPRHPPLLPFLPLIVVLLRLL